MGHPGAHCDGCKGGGAGVALGALVVVLLLAVYVANEAQAIEHFLRVLLDVVIWTVVATAGVTVAVVAGVVIVRRRRAVSHAERLAVARDRSSAGVGARPAAAALARPVQQTALRGYVLERRDEVPR